MPSIQTTIARELNLTAAQVAAEASGTERAWVR